MKLGTREKDWAFLLLNICVYATHFKWKPLTLILALKPHMIWFYPTSGWGPFTLMLVHLLDSLAPATHPLCNPQVTGTIASQRLLPWTGMLGYMPPRFPQDPALPLRLPLHLSNLNLFPRCIFSMRLLCPACSEQKHICPRRPLPISLFSI